MNWNQIESQWTQITGHVKSKWPKLTDTDILKIAGKQEQLVDKVQERYGVLKMEAEKQVHDWSTKFSPTHAKGDAKNDAKPAAKASSKHP
jgi:uncharacterized protein YjbJ (UPF0337 family)